MIASTQSGICPSETNNPSSVHQRQFIGQRIKQLAQRRNLVELSGDDAVERIGQHCGQIGNQRARCVADDKAPNDDGQKQNPNHRQGVGNIDDLILFDMLHGMSPLPVVPVYHKNGAVCR